MLVCVGGRGRGWNGMNDLRFNALFVSISDITVRKVSDNYRLDAMEPRLCLKRTRDRKIIRLALSLLSYQGSWGFGCVCKGAGGGREAVTRCVLSDYGEWEIFHRKVHDVSSKFLSASSCIFVRPAICLGWNRYEFFFSKVCCCSSLHWNRVVRYLRVNDPFKSVYAPYQPPFRIRRGKDRSDSIKISRLSISAPTASTAGYCSTGSQ